MTTHTPILRAVQTDVIEPIETAPAPVSDLKALGDKLLSAATTEVEIAEQIMGFLERGVDRSVRNQWIDEIVKRTHHKRADVNKLAKRVEVDFLREQADNKPDDSKGPLIGVADFKDLLEHGRKALIAAVDAYGSSRIVSYLNCPSEIMEQDDGTVVIHQLSRDEFAEILDEVAEFHELTKDGDIINVPATREIVSRLYARSRSGMFPVLKGLLHTPCLLPSGLLLKPGLDVQSGYYLHPSVEVANLPDEPSDDEIQDAKFLLCHDLFGDAMLGGVSRKDIAKGVIPPGLANAVGLLVTYFARPAIEGGTPIWMLTKPSAGSGASTLMGGISLVALGSALTTVKFLHDDDALSKFLLAEVRAGTSSIVFDNVVGSIDSPTLAQATTSGKLRGRVMGKTQVVEAPWRAIVSFTGNRPDLSEELVDRACALDFDPGHAAPATRNFQHENYEQWVKDHRADLVRAALLLIRRWEALGRPGCPKALAHPRFTDWSAIVGGIMATNGFDTFNLERAEKLEDLATSDEADEHQRAVEAWAQSNRRGDDLLVQDLIALWEKSAYEPPRKLRDGPLAGTHDLASAKVGRWLKEKHLTVFAVTLDPAKPEAVSFYKLARGKRANAGYLWSITEVPAPDAPE